MIRTQISLTEEEYKEAKKQAKRLGISLAAFLREALKQLFPVDSSGKPWMRYRGLVASGDEHSSQNIDDLIYGQKD